MRACVFATIHTESTRLLMRLFQETGMGALVGKVGMNRNSPEGLSEKVEEMVRHAAQSDFLNNHGRKPFLASAEWLLREENFIKVINGNYDNTADGWKPRDPIAERREREEAQRRYAREVEREEHERRMREREEWARGAVTYEEYQRMKKNGEV
jgi:hypothetical protein